MHLDPVYSLVIRLGFALLFSDALVHKLVNWSAFKATLDKYLMGIGAIPASLATPIAAFVVASETCVVALCVRSSSGALITSVLVCVLLLYGTAMLVNLVRGNVLLDCGCSWGATRQPIHSALVARNAGLALVAVPLVLPIDSRSLGPMDVVTLCAAVLTVAILYAALNQLLTNSIPKVREVE